MPTRHLLFALILCRHSEFPAFLWLTSLPLHAASSSPHIAVVYPIDLLVSASRESGVLSQRSISTLRKFDLHGSDFTAQWGRSVGACLHIPRGREGAREKRASARWGVCKAPTGASPRNPQLPHSSVVPSRNPLQIARFCRTGPARDGKFACKSNF